MKANSGEIKKRVLFIYPPSPVIMVESDIEQKFPPSDLLMMAAIAEQCGFEAKIKDYTFGGDLISDIETFEPQYLVANISIQNFKSDMKFIENAKLEFPALKLIVKGMPFLTYNINAIYENSYLDYIILGEPELTIKEILEGVPDEEILGICYSENMQGVKNELRPLTRNLDSLPLPARHLLEDKYKTVIEVSRGCPNNCFFCPKTPFTGQELRIRSVEHVIAEIKECVERFRIKTFLLDSGVFQEEWLKDFCNKYIESGLNVKWAINLIPKSIDDKLAKLLHKSGCRIVNLEVESGSEEILNNIGKKTTIDDIRKTVLSLKKSGLKINCRFTIGLPWETKKTIEESVNFAMELDSDNVHFEFAKPYPGTKFFTYAMLNRLCPSNLSFDKSIEQPIVRSHELSIEQIFKLRNEGLRRYYSRPRFLMKKFFQIRTLDKLKQFFKVVFCLLKRR